MTNQGYAETLRISTSDEIDSLPADEYVLGDPCYSLSDPVWMLIVDALGDLRSGQVTVELPDNRSFTGIFFSPYEGDGVYEIRDTEDALPVDSGLLALLPTELLEEVGSAPESYSAMTVVLSSEHEITTGDSDGYFIIRADKEYAVSLGNM